MALAGLEVTLDRGAGVYHDLRGKTRWSARAHAHTHTCARAHTGLEMTLDRGAGVYHDLRGKTR